MRRDRLLAMMFLVGCGGGGDRSPAEKCDDFVDSFCDRVVGCVTGATGMHGACVEAFKSDGFSCADVKSVSAGYDRCMDQIDSRSCGALFPVDPNTGEQTVVLPADCSMILIGSSATADDAFRNAMYSRVSKVVGLAHDTGTP